MNYVTIGVDLTDNQYQTLKQVTGNKYNIGEILSVWCANQINQIPDLASIFQMLPGADLADLLFEEMQISLPKALGEELEKWPAKRLDEVIYKGVTDLLGQDIRNEPLSHYEIDELLADLDSNSGDYGPTSRFSYDRVFEGKGNGARLVSIRILARAKILDKMRAGLKDKGFSSLQLYILDSIERVALS